jgi:hypothetical protein
MVIESFRSLFRGDEVQGAPVRMGIVGCNGPGLPCKAIIRKIFLCTRVNGASPPHKNDKKIMLVENITFLPLIKSG